MAWNWFGTRARRRAAAGLVVGGSLTFVGAQQVLDPLPDAHDLQPLDSTSSVIQLSVVNPAVSGGPFEEVPGPGPTPQPTAAPTPAPTAAPTLVPTLAPTLAPTVGASPEPTAAPEPRLFETGIASTYGEGDGFEGNRTACGQIFHTGVVQIAHKSLPCGTLVRVVDTSSGNSVDARVTDRGPYVAGRVVDLSWGAFEQLHPAGPGLLQVDLFLLDE